MLRQRKNHGKIIVILARKTRAGQGPRSHQRSIIVLSIALNSASLDYTFPTEPTEPQNLTEIIGAPFICDHSSHKCVTYSVGFAVRQLHTHVQRELRPIFQLSESPQHSTQYTLHQEERLRCILGW